MPVHLWNRHKRQNQLRPRTLRTSRSMPRSVADGAIHITKSNGFGKLLPPWFKATFPWMRQTHANSSIRSLCMIEKTTAGLTRGA